MPNIITFDTETHLIGPQRLAPAPVCVTTDSEEFGNHIAVVSDPATFAGVVEGLIGAAEDGFVLVGHNTKFDLGVLCANDPSLLPRVFALLREGRFEDTIIREKLLHLTETGSMEYIENPDGTNRKIGYSLSDLVLHYLGTDISAGKKHDAWRMHYAELESVPLEEWPGDAVAYALEDAVWTRKVWEAQEIERERIIALTGYDPFKVLHYRVRLDFCLHLMSCWGFAIDAGKVAEIQAMLAEELAPEKMTLMVEAGVLIPGRPGRPHKKNPEKLTNPVPEKVSKKTLAEIVENLCNEHGIEYPTTPTGNISTTMGFLEEISHLSPMLDEYIHRQKLQKLVTTEIPRMMFEDRVAEVVHPMYDCLKATGRTSSYGSKIVPSLNCQNVDPRVRQCFVPRPGTLLFSIDYSQMELGTLAQTNLNLFGYSIMAEKINAKYDLHAYLGAQILANTEGMSHSDPDDRYRAFLEMKATDADKFKHFRTLAKPTGLGYPGGLGAQTFITYAKQTYGVQIDLATAELLREVWFETFPEMKDYFNHINRELSDPFNADKYAYVTPMGMRRAGADYCAAANGLGLQSPSAEGATQAVCEIVEYATLGVLEGVRPIAFVHDELIGEVVENDLLQDNLQAMSEIMVECMRRITPDVRVSAEPVLMRAWDKNAEQVRDEQGRITVWEPSK